MELLFIARENALLMMVIEICFAVDNVVLSECVIVLPGSGSLCENTDIFYGDPTTTTTVILMLNFPYDNFE